MKILQIINSLETAGAEKLLLDTIPLYIKQGIEMDVLLLWDNGFPFTQALKEINCCKVFILNESENSRQVYNPMSVFKIKKIIKAYDIVHLHVFPSQYFAVFANLLNLNKTKLILTEHNTSNGRITNKIFKPIEKFVYSRYDKVICITPEIEKQYRRYLGLTGKLLTINNGVDITKINEALPYTKTQEGFSEEDRLLIMVARFSEQKDQDTVIRALQHMPESYKLLLAGDGKRRKELEDLVSELNLSERVTFLGIRPDIFPLYKMCDIAILSSHWEGFGLAAVEAMACGIPTLATRVEGLAQIVENAGVLFTPGNEVQLAEIILSLRDEAYYSDIAAKCRDRAQKYHISEMVNKHIILYHSLMK